MAFTLGPPKPHIPVSRYAAFDASLYSQFFKFTFVRNPWDRLLSTFTHLLAAANEPVWHVPHLYVSRFPNFESFVLALEHPNEHRKLLRFIHFRPQVDWLTMPGSNKITIDFVGRYENLAEDFGSIAARFEVSTELPKVNASRHPGYREVYSQRMRDIVAELYGQDIETLRYRF